MDEVSGSVSDNRRVKLKLQPVLPVMIEFFCECSRPPTLLPPPISVASTEPPQFMHQCPNCLEAYVLNHASGSVMYQKLDKPEDGPKLEVVSRLPS